MAKKHFEKIVIQNGGIVGHCWECKELTLLRMVTETRNMAPMSSDSWQDNARYTICDKCTDQEKALFMNAGAEVIDGRDGEIQNVSR